MEYIVNERFFERVLEIKAETNKIGQDNDAITKYFLSSVNTDDDSIIFIFSGYLDAIEDGAELANVTLDMTYDTANNIMPAIIALANFQNKTGYPDNQHNAEITMKTMAAYLTMMAVNNHSARIKVDKKGNSRGSERPDLWSDRYYLRINNKRDSDFLPYAIEGINTAPIEGDNGFTVDINPLIGAYKRITGVDLADYGLSNLIIDFNDNNFDISDDLIESHKEESEKRYSLNSLKKLIDEVEEKLKRGESISKFDEQLLSTATVVIDFILLAKKLNANPDLTVENEREFELALAMVGAQLQEEGIGESYIVQEIENIAASYQLFALINMFNQFGVAADPFLNESSNHLVIGAGQSGDEEQIVFDTYEAMHRVKDTCFFFTDVNPHSMGIKEAKPEEVTRSIAVSIQSFRDIVEKEFLQKLPE